MEISKWHALYLLFLTLIAACYWTIPDFRTTFLHQLNSNATVKRQLSQHNVKRIATWTTVFNEQAFADVFDGRKQVRLNCSNQCILHTRHGDPLFYDALLFHARDNQHWPLQRRPDQIYVMYMWESPAYPGPHTPGDFYNWTATYDPRSDLWMPYLQFRKKDEPGFPSNFFPASLPQMTHHRIAKEAIVAWVVSNCRTPAKREQYVHRLQGFIKVDIFGRCGKQCYKNQVYKAGACQKALAKTGIYKFYLSFENSACRAYITDKVYHPLSTGLVPIVYGGLSHQDYVDLLPPHSFIDVRDFKSPKHLAEYLLYLDGNDTAYKEYHYWRRDYEFGGGTNFLCWVCDRLYNSTMMRPRSVNWRHFWGVGEHCDNQLLNKVNGNAYD